jgi:hypothetical protein
VLDEKRCDYSDCDDQSKGPMFGPVTFIEIAPRDKDLTMQADWLCVPSGNWPFYTQMFGLHC